MSEEATPATSAAPASSRKEGAVAKQPLSERLKSKKQSSAAPVKQVRLRLIYIDFWSVTKMAFLTMVALGIVTLVAVMAVWLVLNQIGIYETLLDFLELMLDEAQYTAIAAIGLGEVMGFMLIVIALNIIVGTALGAIAALLYNFAVKISGGILLGFSNN